MQNSQNKKTLQIVLIVLVAVLTLGIGYASISAINLIIDGNATANPNDNNFKVKFLNEDGVTPMIEGAPTNTVQVDSDTTASFNVATLNGAGQSVTATYRVKNESSGIGASIGLQLTNSNPDYFKVTQKILDNKLQAGEETTVTVKVEMLKTPVESAVSTSITATLIATPIEDAEASGGTEQEEIVPKPISYVYTINGVDFIYINTDISAWTRVYSNFPAAKAEFGHPTAIANIVDNGKVTESYVAFEKNNKVYYLKGRINESELAEKPVYEHNVSVLKEAFPDWETTCTDDTSSFNCTVDGFHAGALTNGHVSAGGSDWYCGVSGDGGNANCVS